MAILKKIVDSEHPSDPRHLVMPSFSFSTDDGSPVAAALAQMIVDAWTNGPFTYTPPGGGVAVTVQHLGDALGDRVNGLPSPTAKQTATAYVQNNVGLDVTDAVVITEREHNNDYVMQSGNEIVLVLPDENRVTSITAPNILETAKFLMACTPNGI
jgi:hypothetical protein